LRSHINKKNHRKAERLDSIIKRLEGKKWPKLIFKKEIIKTLIHFKHKIMKIPAFQALGWVNHS
jgi:hypothetical protein